MRICPPEIAALVFDFDRTLAPLGNLVRWRVAHEEMRKHYAAAGIADEVLGAAPRGCFGLYRHVALAAGLDPAALARLQAEVSAILARFEEEGIAGVAPYADAEPLLRALPEMSLRAAIVSSNPEGVIRAVLARHGLEERFAAVVGRDGLAEIKPSPDGMLRCAAALALSPARCLGVGDNAGDVAASLAAGMPAIGVATGVSTRAQLLAAGARAVFSSLEELHAQLRSERLKTS